MIINEMKRKSMKSNEIEENAIEVINEENEEEKLKSEENLNEM